MAQLLRFIKGLIKDHRKKTELAGLYVKKYRAPIIGTQIREADHGIYKD